MKNKRKIDKNKFIYTDADMPGITIIKKDTESADADARILKEIKVEESDLDNIPWEGVNYFAEIDYDDLIDMKEIEKYSIMDTKQIEFCELINELHRTSRVKEIEAQFLVIAAHLMNKLCIATGDKKYRIMECEIYYNDNLHHQDTYLYGSKHEYAAVQQIKMLHWYFHDSGIDLTIGNNSAIKGGILIRAAQEIDDNNDSVGQPLKGPVIFRDAILNNTSVDVFSPIRKICLEALEDCKEEGLISTQRFGIDVGKEIKDINYSGKEYRYITKEHFIRLKGKENIAKQLFNDGRLSLEEAMNLSGRKKIFFK